MSCPPTPDVEAVQYDFQRGRRSLRTPNPLAGTGFHGFVEDEEHDTQPLKPYVQGGPVNLASYYDDQSRKVARMRKENPRTLTQKKNPIRNLSQLTFGDTYYYSGKHMYQTTTKESFGENIWFDDGRPSSADAAASVKSSNFITLQSPSRNSTVSSPFRSQAQSSRQGRRSLKTFAVDGVEEDPMEYQYKQAQALVGRARIENLHRQVKERVQAKVVSGNKDMIRTFNFFAKNEGTKGHAVIGHAQFLSIAQKLGVYMTAREAMALFGRYDDDSSGHVTYFEFIDRFFEQGDRKSVV